MDPHTEISEEVHKRLRTLFSSNHRTDIVLALNEGKRTVGDLRDAVRQDGPSIIHSLRIFEAYHFVGEDGRRAYYLTAFGKNLVRKVIDLTSATEVLIKHEKFWIEHDLSGIPDQLFDQIGALRDSALIENTGFDPQKAAQSFVELLKGAAAVELVASVNAPDPHFLYDKFVSAQKHIELVLTEPVFHHAIEQLGSARVKKTLSEGNKLYVLRQDPKLVLAVTDHAIALLLHRLDGSYDYSAVLTSRSEEALAWGHDMFHHYVDLSESFA